jgi:Transposase DNA-binding
LSGVRDRPRCEDEEVQAILEASAGIDSFEWVENEFAGANLGDERLNRRLRRTAVYKGNSPQAPINQACRGWPGSKAAYRFYKNKKVKPEKIIAPHVAATARRALDLAVEERVTVLAASDTVFISSDVPGNGPIGKDNEGRGLIMHNVLLMTTAGVPLGLLHQNIWVRDEVPEETRQQKIERLQRTPIRTERKLQVAARFGRHPRA